MENGDARLKAFASLLLLVVLTFPAQAAPIIGLYATGVDNSGNLLSTGNIDPHYTRIASPSTPFSSNAIVQGGLPSTWIANGPNSKWIGPTFNGNQNLTPGLYAYRTTFFLGPGSVLSSAVINGTFAGDNVVNITLNGVATGQQQIGFSSYGNFTLTSGFQLGLNTLDFYVFNAGSSNNPTGLRVDTIQGEVTVVPEIDPGAANAPLALLAGALLLARDRRRRSEMAPL